MTRITRSSHYGLTTLPARRAAKGAPAAVAPVEKVLPPRRAQPRPSTWQPPAMAGKPVATFLAQFIDQHWLWPGPRHGNAQDRATQAYGNAEALSDEERARTNALLDRWL